MSYAILPAVLVLLGSSAALAQTADADQVGDSAVGQAGQRQTREEMSGTIAPMDRINNRIQNRIQSRARNRIDRNFDSPSSTKSPFVAAEEVSAGANATGIK